MSDYHAAVRVILIRTFNLTTPPAHYKLPCRTRLVTRRQDDRDPGRRGVAAAVTVPDSVPAHGCLSESRLGAGDPARRADDRTHLVRLPQVDSDWHGSHVVVTDSPAARARDSELVRKTESHSHSSLSTVTAQTPVTDSESDAAVTHLAP
jgi:hypothetical protein